MKVPQTKGSSVPGRRVQVTGSPMQVAERRALEEARRPPPP
jgi:hypothetical protein